MTKPHESYVLVLEYLYGTLNLTEFPLLTSQERHTFTPLWHGVEFIAGIQERQIADVVKLEALGST